jgi:hypothetical protein
MLREEFLGAGREFGKSVSKIMQPLVESVWSDDRVRTFGRIQVRGDGAGPDFRPRRAREGRVEITELVMNAERARHR